jgi:hypothetical protein
MRGKGKGEGGRERWKLIDHVLMLCRSGEGSRWRSRVWVCIALLKR